MLDLVPPAGSGREVTDGHLQPGFRGERREFRVSQPVAVAVVPARVCGDQHPVGARILLASRLALPATDRGMSKTLTVLRLGVSPTLGRTLRSTNSIESMISIARTRSVNVKNWQNGTMALRWCSAGMIEAGKQFRRVNGHLHLAALRVAVDAHVAAETVGTVRHDEPVIAA